MRGNWMCAILLSLSATASLAACASNGVQQGIISTSGPGQGTASASTTAGAATANSAAIGSTGRVVAINEVGLNGGGGGYGNGPVVGAVMGGLGGAAIGISTAYGRGWVGPGIVGALIGAVGGAIAGAIIDQHGTGPMGGGRGIEVTVQKDDGSKLTIAQHDDGDVQLGDRVQIVQGRNGVAKAVRDTSRTVDQSQGSAPPPDYNSQPPGGGGVPPQDNPRYGTLN